MDHETTRDLDAINTFYIITQILHLYTIPSFEYMYVYNKTVREKQVWSLKKKNHFDMYQILEIDVNSLCLFDDGPKLNANHVVFSTSF